MCQDCLISILQIQRKACPFCQRALKGPVYHPKFNDASGDVPEKEAGEKRKLEGPVTVEMYKQSLMGAGNQEDTIFLRMSGKMDAFKRDLHAWKESSPPDEQIVIFAKEMEPSTYFHQIITEEGLSVLCAGLMGVRKLQSITNIEKFRQGESRVLFVSTKYSSGFDLYMARRLWIINTDLDPSIMDQSKGRVTRLVQKYDQVDIRVFVYPGGFDQFLWETRSILNLKQTGFRNQHVFMYYVYILHALGTSAGAINMRQKIKKIKFGACDSSNIHFNNGWKYSDCGHVITGAGYGDDFII